MIYIHLQALPRENDDFWLEKERYLRKPVTLKERQGKVRTCSDSLSDLHWNIFEQFLQQFIRVSSTLLLFLLLSTHKNHVLVLTSSRLHRMNVMPLTETSSCLTAWLCTEEGLYMPSIYIEVISSLKTMGVLPMMSKVIGFQPNHCSNVIWHKSTKICGATWIHIS